jgi:hypothetical protein
VKDITGKMGVKQHGSTAEQCTCTLVTGDQTVPYQTQRDSFGASSIFPLLSLLEFPFSAIKECSERIVIHKHRGSLCKSDESSDRGVENVLQDCFQNLYERWQNCITAQRNYFERNTM